MIAIGRTARDVCLGAPTQQLGTKLSRAASLATVTSGINANGPKLGGVLASPPSFVLRAANEIENTALVEAHRRTGESKNEQASKRAREQPRLWSLDSRERRMADIVCAADGWPVCVCNVGKCAMAIGIKTVSQLANLVQIWTSAPPLLLLLLTLCCVCCDVAWPGTKRSLCVCV